MGLEGRIKGIHLGIHRHLHLVFEQTMDEPTRTAALNYILGRFNASPADTVKLERATHSILKFTAVPTVANDG